jgi:hypothetical protein
VKKTKKDFLLTSNQTKMVNDKQFYSQYLKEYHSIKAIYLKILLDNHDKLNVELEKHQAIQNLTKNSKFVLQADMRQNYFHCIETFFELFFAFLPKNGTIPDHHNIIKLLVKSDWKTNYKLIQDIADGNFSLDIFDQQIEFLGYTTTVAKYLFYPGMFDPSKFTDEFFKNVDHSIIAIKSAIKTLALDFSQRDEYNAYKHGIRIFPSYKSIQVVSVDDMKEKIKWDLSNSVSFYTFNDKLKESKITTKLFDSERDFLMTRLCSNLIFTLINYRDVVVNPEQRQKDEQIKINFFDLDSVEDCKQHHVDVQDIVFSNQMIPNIL